MANQPWWIENAKCRKCRYPLRDLPALRCPECGTSFSLDDPKTVRLASTWDRLVFGLAIHPSRYYEICCWGIVAICFAVSFYPNRYRPGDEEKIGAAITLCSAVWSIRLFVFVYAIFVIRMRFELNVCIRWRRWLASPMLIVLSLGLLIYKPLFFIGFEISKASLDKIVKTNRNSAGDQDGWAGIYPIVEVRELEDVAI